MKNNSGHKKFNSSLQRLPMLMLCKVLLYNNEEFLINVFEATNNFMKKSIKNHLKKFQSYNSNIAICNFSETLSSVDNTRFKVQCYLNQIQRIVIKNYSLNMDFKDVDNHHDEIARIAKKCSHLQELEFDGEIIDYPSTIFDDDIVLDMINSISVECKLLKSVVCRSDSISDSWRNVIKKFSKKFLEHCRSINKIVVICVGFKKDLTLKR